MTSRTDYWVSGFSIYGPTTSDFPGWYVVRMWRVYPSPMGVRHAFTGCLCATLAEARQQIAHLELTYIGRQPDDDPVIIETWI